MSFQGDVRGIGLAELLQGLARGRKEGILTLTSDGGARCVLGLEEGKAHLLPDQEEDAELWRTRVRDAWGLDDVRVDYLRMSVVARAQRLEDLYTLLDGGGVHFRFEPGAIPRPAPAPGEETERSTQVFCEGLQVEFLLLEYARTADELEGKPQARELPVDLVPCLLDPAAAGGTPMNLLEQCDGRSTLREIADRLGWPVRQVCLSLYPALAAGGLRRAHPDEVLQLALHELQTRRVSRAAVRINAWCREGLPGPLDLERAERLESEWLAGRLTAALRAIPARSRRALLRRMDHGLGNPSQTVVHWLEVARLDKTDRIARLKRLAAEFREGSNPDAPSVRDLLDWAREQRDSGHPRRGAPALVMAAHRQPTNTMLQLELGTGLVAAGRPLEGAPWVLAGGRELLHQGHADRAVSPLRALLDKDPRNRECRQLLTRARRKSTTVRKLRKNLLLGLVATSLLAGAALVKVQVDAGRQRLLDQVRQQLADPQSAQRLLDERFADDDSSEVRALREQIQERQRLDEFEQRSAWLATYHDAQLETTKGDPVSALYKIRALSEPPLLMLIQEPWPEPDDLYESLVDHLEAELEALGAPVEGSPQQVAREDQIESWCETLIVTVLANPQAGTPVASFVQGLEQVKVQVAERRGSREVLIGARLADENLEHQDELYRKGEAYAASGDLVRALACWVECTSLDTSGKVTDLLDERIAEVRRQLDAVERAKGLARQGRHAQAIVLLEEAIEDPSDFVLPWRVESFPSGVKVAQGEDRVWTTPFEIVTPLGERVELTFEHPGFERRTLVVERPADQLVHLDRSPDRAWFVEGRIDAVPVPVGADHLVVDRKGHIARIGPGGALRWQTRVRTLSGIARAPVFLPRRPGHLLLVTEDGAAWILAAEGGRLEGPWDLGDAPMIGPAPHGDHVRVLLNDGREIQWSDVLKPARDEAFGGPDADDADLRYGSEAGFVVARRRAGHLERFPCPWNEWVVEIREGDMRVHLAGQPATGYSVLRQDEWEFVAWESPSARVPHGRLWISDGAGLRAFTPLGR